MLPRNNEKIYWYPYWGGFYFMSKGYLVVKMDMGFSTDDADVVDPSLDTCNSDTPIFLCDGLSDSDCYEQTYY